MTVRLTPNAVLRLALIAAGGFVAASLVVGMDSPREEEVVQPAQRVGAGKDKERVPDKHQNSRAMTAAGTLDLSKLRRPATQTIEDDLFGAYVPPAAPLPPTLPTPAAQQAPPPKPTAPPLPFKFLGRIVDGSAQAIFVAKSGQNLILRDGDVIDNVYRVESVGETQAIFVFIPLDERQTLQIGERP